MNKFTFRELSKVSNLIQEDWDINSTHLIIPNKDGIVKNTISVGEKFTIKLENYIINQPPNFTLSENWNQGTIPPEQILDVEVMRVMGKMIGVKAVGKNSKEVWEGWLPEKGFKII